MTPPAPGAVTSKKAVARVALIELDDATRTLLTDCFRQFGIQTVRIAGEDAQGRLQKEKFEAMVLRLDSRAEQLLATARSSPSNCRIVIYVVAATPQQPLQYSRHGINAVLDEPVERQAALRVVRGTHLLVLHELRRYVRVPMATEVSVVTDTRRLAAQSQEISGGGMSLKVDARLPIGQIVDIAFNLPGKPGIKVGASVCWVREADNLIGVRFSAEDERRLAVREWINDYLEIS